MLKNNFNIKNQEVFPRILLKKGLKENQSSSSSMYHRLILKFPISKNKCVNLDKITMKQKQINIQDIFTKKSTLNFYKKNNRSHLMQYMEVNPRKKQVQISVETNQNHEKGHKTDRGIYKIPLNDSEKQNNKLEKRIIKDKQKVLNQKQFIVRKSPDILPIPKLCKTIKNTIHGQKKQQRKQQRVLTNGKIAEWQHEHNNDQLPFDLFQIPNHPNS